jgi:protein-L-isoaspartate O-methyltransferase
MPQNYANIDDSLNDFNIVNVVEYTKSYSANKLVAYIKATYPKVWPIVMEQIRLSDKANKKLPTWLQAGCLFTAKSFEQCSSLPLATYKASLISGNTLVDLSAGLGVDDAAFAQVFKKVIGVDADLELNVLVRYNFKKLGITNVSRVDAFAEYFLTNFNEPIDVVYIDADRRTANNQKVYTLQDSSPNILALIPVLLKNSTQILLKLSPMVDISYLKQTLPNVAQIQVVGIKNEVKEVLVLLDKEATETEIKAVQVNALGKVEFEFSSMKQIETNAHSETNFQYFYEPANMVIKAGLSGKLAEATDMQLVAKNSHYMLSKSVFSNYFGRGFKILHYDVFSKSEFSKYIKQLNLTKANVSARNFVATVDELRKAFKLADGGEEYLFFTTNALKQKLFWHCHKING